MTSSRPCSHGFFRLAALFMSAGWTLDATPADPPAVRVPPLMAVPDTTRGAIFWRTSYATAMKEARESGKPLLLVFYTTWCAYCVKMHHTTLDAPEIRETIVKFIPAMVDAEAEVVAARRFTPTGFPEVVVVDPLGREVVRFLGYQAPEKFRPALEGIQERIAEFSKLSADLESGPPERRQAVLTRLGDLFAACGFPDRALEHYEKVLRRSEKGSPERQTLLARTAQAALLADKGSEGERCYRKLLEEFPASGQRADYLLGLGRALIAEGKAEKARGVLARLESEHTGTPQAAEAIRILSGQGN